MTPRRYCSLFSWSCFALSVRLFLDWCLEFRLRPPAGRLEGFLFPAVAGEVTISLLACFNPTPRERGTCYSNRLYWFIPSMEGSMAYKAHILALEPVHPLDEGKSAYSAVNQKSIPKQTFLSCLFGSDTTICRRPLEVVPAALEGPVMRRTFPVSRYCFSLSSLCLVF